MRANDFHKTVYVDNEGLYINIDQIIPVDSFDKDLILFIRNKLLNKTLKFVNSKKECNEKIKRCFHFNDIDTADDYEDLYLCCKEAVDAGYNYCPECGNDVSDYKYNGFDSESGCYDSFKDDKMFKENLLDEDDFEQKYIEMYEKEDDFFDDICVYSNLYMEEGLFDKVKEELEKEGIKIK